MPERTGSLATWHGDHNCGAAVFSVLSFDRLHRAGWSRAGPSSVHFGGRLTRHFIVDDCARHVAQKNGEMEKTGSTVTRQHRWTAKQSAEQSAQSAQASEMHSCCPGAASMQRGENDRMGLGTGEPINSRLRSSLGVFGGPGGLHSGASAPIDSGIPTVCGRCWLPRARLWKVV